MDYKVLKAELEQDPAGMGYGAMEEDYGAMEAALNERPMVENPVGYSMVADVPAMEEVLLLMEVSERVALLSADSLKELTLRAWGSSVPELIEAMDVVIRWVAEDAVVVLESATVQGAAARMLEVLAAGRGDKGREKAMLAVLEAMIGVLAVDPGLSEETVGRLKVRLAKRVRDPSWQAEVVGESRGMVLGLGQVAAVDVQAAVHLRF